MADPERVRHAGFVHVMAVGEHFAADERVEEVALGPETGPFPAYVDVCLGLGRVWHLDGWCEGGIEEMGSDVGFVR